MGVIPLTQACPDGHGRLLEGPWGERLFCPHSAHGGNGRFFSPSDAREVPMTPTATVERKVTPAPKPSAKRTTKPKPEAKTPATGKTPRACLCGCGGMTKGGRFLPGHDARFHAAQKKAAAEVATK